MGRQIGGTIEDLIALGAAVLDVNDAGTPVLSQPEGVIEQLPAQTANIVADPVLNLGLFIYQQNKGLSTCGAISGRNGTRTGVIPLDSFKCEAGVCVCVCVCVYQFGAGFIGDVDDVERRVDITWTHHHAISGRRFRFHFRSVADDRTRHR